MISNVCLKNVWFENKICFISLQSRHTQDFLELRLFSQIFSKISQVIGQMRRDLFAICLSNQTQLYFSWKPESQPQGTCNAAELFISGESPTVCTPSFVLVPAVLETVVLEKVQSLILVTQAWQIQSQYP